MTIQVEIVLPQAELAARDQGTRPTCIAFALSEVNLGTLRELIPLSPEYAYVGAAHLVGDWKPGDGVPLSAALRAVSRGQPVEDDFPYQPHEPEPPVLAPPSTLPLHGRGVSLLPVSTSIICDRLRQLVPVGVGLRLTRSFYYPIEDVVAFEPEPVEPLALHAVAAVGLGWDGNEPHFLIRNSWGARWGKNGSAWVSGRYLGVHAICAFSGS
ncbi:C1 family peptidase [Pseudoxanthomonas suwonensis]|uniref:C1 family peptidase n=1 Tax=Pseudoxanthomonas suwonensis TaxID=314722 RepID=UPI003CCCEA0B